MELILVRHALPQRVDGPQGAGGRAGPADPELSATGHEQARHLAEYLAQERIGAVYASPLRRAVQTAQPLAARRSVEIDRPAAGSTRAALKVGRDT